MRPLADSPNLPLSLMTLRGKNFSQAEDQMREQIRAHQIGL